MEFSETATLAVQKNYCHFGTGKIIRQCFNNRITAQWDSAEEKKNSLNKSFYWYIEPIKQKHVCEL